MDLNVTIKPIINAVNRAASDNQTKVISISIEPRFDECHDSMAAKERCIKDKQSDIMSFVNGNIGRDAYEKKVDIFCRRTSNHSMDAYLEVLVIPNDMLLKARIPAEEMSDDVFTQKPDQYQAEVIPFTDN